MRLAVDLGFKALAAAFPPVAFLFVGPLGSILAHFARGFLGVLADKGILNLDLTLDSIRIGAERKEYREDALKAFEKASARVYTEEEKRAIREEYLKILRKFGRVGDGIKP